MVWFNVDDTLAFHPKAIEAGNAALGLWVRAGSWSAQTLSDGFVPRQIARSLGTVGQCKALIVAGLWLEVEGGYRFHEWDQRQQTKEDVQSRREMERKRKADQRKRSRVPAGQTPDIQPDDPRDSRWDSTWESQPESAPESSQLSGPPIPSLPFPSSFSGPVEGGSYVSNARENEPPPPTCPAHKILDPHCADCAATSAAREEWLGSLLAATEPSRHCPRHPTGTDEPCRDCQGAREFHARWQRDRKAAAEERRRSESSAQSAAAHEAAQLRAAAMDACPLGCGQAEVRGYLGGRLCDHDPDAAGRAARHLAAMRAELARKKAAKDLTPSEPPPDPNADQPPPETDWSVSVPSGPPEPASQDQPTTQENAHA